MTTFKVNPLYQRHKVDELSENIRLVKDSEIFFIFGDRSYVEECQKLQSETLGLIDLAKQLNKPFILCLDNSLPINDQTYLRKLCPNKTQVFSFNPTLYTDNELHKRMMVIINSAINNEIISDPFKEGRKTCLD